MKMLSLQLQQKFLAKNSLDELERVRRTVTAAEKRQDGQAGFPGDFLRHWSESDRDERKLLLARETQRHMSAGVCCVPSCLVWLWSLRVARRCMARCIEQKAQAASEGATAAAAAAAAASASSQERYYIAREPL